MRRILFEKTGSGIWISHLDLMRVLQRAFRRADLPLRHTQGYNPHAFVSIALPLSVGTASQCELLEFELELESVDLASLPEQLNRVLPAGIHCLEAYDAERKLKELCWLRVSSELEYDAGVPEGACEALTALFQRDALVVEKKSKNGPVETDIRPLLRSLEAHRDDEHTVVLEAVVQAQNPPLNPDLLAKAVKAHLPSLAPDFAKSTRLELYDADLQVFR